MKLIVFLRFIFTILITIYIPQMTYSKTIITADNPLIQYYGRWDFSDPLNPRHSWPGVYICAGFTGRTIGIRTFDKTNYYNIYIDGSLYKIFHGDNKDTTDYIITDSLENSNHTITISKRNIAFDVFSFRGFILDDGETLTELPAGLSRKIEFIGDSFTAAESNEATQVEGIPWEERFPVTNIDKGFAPLIARYFNAQYHTTCRSGSGIVCDWQGNTDQSVPNKFDRTLMEAAEPKWDFKKWIPDVVVIILGLNDHSGLKDKNGEVNEYNSLLFRKTYHEFLSTIRSVYPGVKVVAVAPFPEWIRKNVKKVVDEEKAKGMQDISYSTFDDYPGGYAGNGHPTVETHRKIANQIIKDMMALKLFTDR